MINLLKVAFLLGFSQVKAQTPPPTSYTAAWMVGNTSVTVSGNNAFDGFLNITNEIGSSITEQVQVQLFDYDCLNEKESMNTTNAVTIFDVNPVPSAFHYSVNVSQSNIGSDTGGFVSMTTNSTGDIKFCTRVKTTVGSVDVHYRDTNFALGFDLTNNTFNVSVNISANPEDVFETTVDTGFKIKPCQCENFGCINKNIKQDTAFVICLEPIHEGGLDVVSIKNFNIKMSAGDVGENDYVEYNPVWFGNGGYQTDSLTNVVQQPNGKILMIMTSVVAQFFIKDHETLEVSGNGFLEFDSASKVDSFVRFMLSVLFDTDTDDSPGNSGSRGCLQNMMQAVRSMFE